MPDKMLKVNILAIVISGLLMFLTGGGLYLFKGFISNHIRYFLPIPPLAVAAYVFVFNMFKYYEGDLPSKKWDIIWELFYAVMHLSQVIKKVAGCDRICHIQRV